MQTIEWFSIVISFIRMPLKNLVAVEMRQDSRLSSCKVFPVFQQGAPVDLKLIVFS